MKTNLVFGTFDQIHPGHDSFLRQAKDLDGQLVVVVARDNVVEKLKGQRPVLDQETRLQNVREHDLIDHAELSDLVIGSFESVYRLKPDVIALGYDQTALSEKLKECVAQHGLPIELITLKPYKPEKYKSSLLNS